MDLSHPVEELFGVNSGRILHRLAIVAEDLSGRRLAELAGVPVASAARVLAELESIGLVTARNVGRARLYRVNRAHVLWGPIEAIMAAPARIEQLAAESVVAHVGDRATLATFGSFARGDAGPLSDLDLLIVWDESVTDEEREETLDAVHQQIGVATGNRVEIVEIDDEDLRRMASVKDPLIDSWRREARTLTGLEFKRRLERAAS